MTQHTLTPGAALPQFGQQAPDISLSQLTPLALPQDPGFTGREFGSTVADIGAFIVGQGGARRARLSGERQKATAQDALSVKNALTRGIQGDQSGFAEAQDILATRIEVLDRTRGDSSDSRALLEQINSGDVEGALREVGTLVEFAQFEKILPKPQEATQFTLAEDATRFETREGVTREIARGRPSGGGILEVPTAMIEGRPPAVQAAFREAFRLAGGGDKGIKAGQKVLNDAGETVVSRENLILAKQTGEFQAQRALLAQQEAKLKTQESVAKADRFISVIDRLIKHPSRKEATGIQAQFPTFRAGGVFNFETLFNQLQGGGFLEAIATLKGSGQISEVEGQAATSAILGLDLAMSDDAFLATLEFLRETVVRGRKRRAGTFDISIPDAPDAPVPAERATGPRPTQEGQIAIDEQTGDKVIFKNGQWVPL